MTQAGALSCQREAKSQETEKQRRQRGMTLQTAFSRLARSPHLQLSLPLSSCPSSLGIWADRSFAAILTFTLTNKKKENANKIIICIYMCSPCKFLPISSGKHGRTLKYSSRRYFIQLPSSQKVNR